MKVLGIEVEVERKAIKHTHLSVFPPDARVHVSAPATLSDDDLMSFLVSKAAWMRRQIASVLAQPRESRREYASGENVYLLGRRYRLLVRPGSGEAGVRVDGTTVVMEGRGLDSRAARESRMMDWQRGELRRVLNRLVSKWGAALDEEGAAFEIRRMRNRWGSCNATRRRMYFNLALARVPIRCIEYVVVHELTHFRVENHSALFERLMTRRLPRWREARRELNDFIAQPVEDGLGKGMA